MVMYIDKNGDILDVVLWDGTADARYAIKRLSNYRALDYETVQAVPGSDAIACVNEYGRSAPIHVGDLACRDGRGAITAYTVEQLEETHSFLGASTI